jgi:hypothetical protein
MVMKIGKQHERPVRRQPMHSPRRGQRKLIVLDGQPCKAYRHAAILVVNVRLQSPPVLLRE